jgi:hypothetical protein
MEWFGKYCYYQICQWEENEITNSNYKEEEPVLVYCNHPDNPDDHEGNCNFKLCPLIIQGAFSNE